MRVALAVLMVVLGAACAGSDSDETAQDSGREATATGAACPVTAPNGRTPPGEQSSPTHHGNGSLWTVLYYPKLIVTSRNVRPDGSIEEKFPWWRDVTGQLTIRGGEVGGSGAPIRADIPPGYGDSGFQASSVIFPTEGCWRVTGRAGNASLTFVVSVSAA